MSQKALTKDEQYMLGLFKLTQAAKSDRWDFEMNEVGEFVGMTPKAVKAVVALLAQAHFVKKTSKTRIQIAPRGEVLAQELLGE